MHMRNRNRFLLKARYSLNASAYRADKSLIFSKIALGLITFRFKNSKNESSVKFETSNRRFNEKTFLKHQKIISLLTH